MPALSPGQRFGTYEVEGMLGQGGMAEVYRALHLRLGRRVALKVLNPELNSDPSFPVRFLREARTAASLAHPNIVTVYDFDDDKGIAYLVMELAEHGTLRDQARSFTTLTDAVTALDQVCRALEYA